MQPTQMKMTARVASSARGVIFGRQVGGAHVGGRLLEVGRSPG
jgi:hypothetical protein